MRSNRSNKFLFHFFATGSLVTAALLTLSCIQRNNPYDPANYHPLAPQSAGLTDSLRTVVRDFSLQRVKAMLAESRGLMTSFENTKKQRLLDSLSRIHTLDSNRIVLARNNDMLYHNDSIGLANISASSVDSLRYKQILDTLFVLVALADTPAIQGARDGIYIRRLKSAALIDSVNLANPLPPIIPSVSRDSLLGLFDTLIINCDRLISSVKDAASMAKDTNSIRILPYNDLFRNYNLTIKLYNDSLFFYKSFLGFVPVTNPDTLTKRLKNATAGDTFVVGSGTFSTEIRFDSSGEANKPIVVIGQPDLSTRFENSDVFLSNNKYIFFRYIIFSKSNSSAVKCENSSGPLEFNHCVFENNGNNGIEIIDSDVKLYACRILNNGGSGILSSSTNKKNHQIFASQTLVAHNRFNGIDLTAVEATLSNVTMSDNGENGIRLSDPPRTLSLTATLISFNGHYGVQFGSQKGSDQSLTISNSVFFGNTLGAISGNFDGLPVYLTYSVEYLNRFQNDYRIAAGNDVFDLQTKGIIIGYRPEK
jgi:hypothetical protein